MQQLFLPLFGVAVLIVLLSSAYLHVFYGRGDRERLPERISWYLGVSALFFFVLTYGERANEPPQNLQMIFGAYLLASVGLAVLQTFVAAGNHMNHLAKLIADKNQHRRHAESSQQPTTAAAEPEPPTAQVLPLEPPRLAANS